MLQYWPKIRKFVKLSATLPVDHSKKFLCKSNTHFSLSSESKTLSNRKDMPNSSQNI